MADPIQLNPIWMMPTKLPWCQILKVTSLTINFLSLWTKEVSHNKLLQQLWIPRHLKVMIWVIWIQTGVFCARLLSAFLILNKCKKNAEFLLVSLWNHMEIYLLVSQFLRLTLATIQLSDVKHAVLIWTLSFVFMIMDKNGSVISAMIATLQISIITHKLMQMESEKIQNRDQNSVTEQLTL